MQALPKTLRTVQRMPPSTAGPDIRCDLVIVGAGPAGTSAALAAIDANPDLDVVIVDAKPPGRDKVCGDAVGPDALGVLARLGVHTLLGADERARTFRVRDIAGNEVGGPSPVPGVVGGAPSRSALVSAVLSRHLGTR